MKVEPMKSVAALTVTVALLVFPWQAKPQPTPGGGSTLGDQGEQVETGRSFGETWGKLQLPVWARVAVIDSADQLEIGLNAMQVDNIGWSGEYDAVIVEFLGKQVRASAYNAFGMRALEGARVRISSALAAELQCGEDDTIGIVALTRMVAVDDVDDGTGWWRRVGGAIEWWWTIVIVPLVPVLLWLLPRWLRRRRSASQAADPD